MDATHQTCVDRGDRGPWTMARAGLEAEGRQCRGDWFGASGADGSIQPGQPVAITCGATNSGDRAPERRGADSVQLPDSRTCPDVQRRRGGTPLYAYSLDALAKSADACLAFPNAYGLTVRYAMKSSPNGSILKYFPWSGGLV
ncbi:hypothetical protein THAOC_11989, partial [Thalassiosira oceanica]